jgi:hypothetical protein
MGLAVRKDVVRVVAAAVMVLGVVEAVAAASSPLLGSGVVGRETEVLKVGRSRLVKEGDGGNGVGGRL